MVSVSAFSADLRVQWDHERNTTTPDEVSISSREPVWWHAPCGHTWDMTPAARKRGAGCPYCAGRRVLAGFNDLPTTHPEIAAEWDHADGGVLPSQVTKGSRVKVRWRCRARGHGWESTVHNRAVRGSGCPLCSRKRVIPRETDLPTTHPHLVGEWAQENERDIASVTATSAYVASWVCKPHGHAWKASVEARASLGKGCPCCAGKVVLVGFNDLSTCRPVLAAQMSDPEVTPEEVTEFSSRRVRWTCPTKPRHHWYARIDDRARGTGCPRCAETSFSSTGEKQVADYLVSLLGEHKVVRNDRSLLGGREVDIYLPEHHLAVEFNGLYWHSEAVLGDRYAHRDKWAACKDAGVQLVTVWEDDWRDRREVIERMLAHKVGMSSSASIGARRCEVVEISSVQARAFLDTHHVQGYASGGVRLGLRARGDGELVAVMVLRREGRDLNLVRYATERRVPGGFSRMLSWVDEQVDFEHMVTFADHEVSDGSLYERHGGWVGEAIEVDYKYVYEGRRWHKFAWRKSRFAARGLRIEPGWSEAQAAEANGLYRVWDCGKTKYVRQRGAG